MKILFITGNKHKAAEAQVILKDFTVETKPLDIPEIQSLDPKEIIRAKILKAKELLKEEGIIMVDDVATYAGDTGLPGPFVKYFYQKLGREGMVTFTRAFGSDLWSVQCHIGLLLPEESEPTILLGEIEGKVVDPRGESGFGFDPIFQPAGYNQTFAEMDPELKNSISHRALAFRKVAAFLKENS